MMWNVWRSFFGLVALSVFVLPTVSSAASITYEGYLTDSSDQPVNDTVDFTFHIDGAGCRLFSESLSATVTDGEFSVKLGTTGTVHNGGSFSDLFKTSGTITGQSSCGFNASGTRSLVIHVDGDVTPIGTLVLTEAPIALAAKVAEKVGSSTEDNLVRVSGGTATALTPVNFTELMALINGTSTAYTNSSQFPVGGTPADGDVLMWSTANSRWEPGTVSGGGGGSGTVTSITVGAGLDGGTITTTGTISLADSGVTTAKIGDSQVTDAKIAGVSGSKISGNIPGNAAGFTGSLGGDVTGTQAATTVEKIRGTPVSATTPTNGHFLKMNAGNWESKPITLSDLMSTVSGTLFDGLSCGAAKTMSYNAVTDQFSCVAIGGLNANVITSGTLDQARLPATIDGNKSFTDEVKIEKLQAGTSAPTCDSDPDNGGKIRYNSSTGFMEYCNHISAMWLPLVTGDISPDPFSISPVTSVFGGTEVESPVYPYGFSVPITVSVSGDGSPQVCNPSPSCTWGPSAVISPGGSFKVKTTASATPGQQITVTVTAGGVSADWHITTATTVDCINGSPNPGDLCSNLTHYAGTIDYGGGIGEKQLMMTPSGCQNSTNPSCSGVPASELFMLWGTLGMTHNATDPLDGNLNTSNILAADPNAPAAKFCADLNYGGFDDWYLPAVGELNHIHTSGAASVSGLQAYTWSSNENSNDNAIEVYMDGGTPSIWYKGSSDAVRCVRRY